MEHWRAHVRLHARFKQLISWGLAHFSQMRLTFGKWSAWTFRLWATHSYRLNIGLFDLNLSQHCVLAENVLTFLLLVQLSIVRLWLFTKLIECWLFDRKHTFLRDGNLIVWWARLHACFKRVLSCAWKHCGNLWLGLLMCRHNCLFSFK